MKQKIDVNRLCNILGVRNVDECFENFEGEAYSYIISHGGTEEEAIQAEQEEMDEVFQKHYDAVMFVAEQLFAEHNLMLVGKGKHTRPSEYYVVPKVSWKDSAAKIITTINGVGYFEFSSVNEFLRSGPYTPTKAVMSHLHWIADWPNVYEGTKASSLVKRRMR